MDEIERELKSAHFFAVLLSEQSIHSDLVRQEVAIAHQLSVDNKLCILPVRVAFTANLPYDLGAYLNPFQHCFWNTGDPFEDVCVEIVAAVSPREAHQSPRPSQIVFAPESLDRLTQELAVFVGPLARILVNRAAKEAHNWQDLRERLASEIPANAERKAFLAKVASR